MSPFASPSGSPSGSAGKLPATIGSAAERVSLDTFTRRLIRLDRGAESILEDAKSFPETPMIQLAAAAFCLLGQTAAADAAGRAYLDAAAPLLRGATDRERRWEAMLRRWLAHDHLGALDQAEALTALWPTDLLAAKIAEFFYYVLGQEHEAPRFRAHMDRLVPANPDDADLLAMAAFAEELCGDLPAAEATVGRALAIDPDQPWAHHCVAHIHLRRGDADAGIAALEGFLPSWIASGRFAHCHNGWHLALAHLDRLDRDRALDLFRRHVWGIAPDLVFEQVDAIALLWRLELAGASVDALWPVIAAHVAGHLGSHYMPFLDAHFVYALARAGQADTVAAWQREVARRTASGDAEAARSWATFGGPLIEAVAAFATGDARKAAALLDPVMSLATIGGGSDAQVDLFRQTYFHALVRSGRKADARAYWSSALGEKPASDLDRWRLALAA
ncbi:MAG: hypothetical protein BGO51_21270 [Rhodospirillales bacterium 69-11]|nr:hypothetical protein [Rhodospirillales bacterium]OJW27431.1 MAG: hypothetical protein BGO51_21270 [Rhodospirillales bacterium 69-11]